jgi:hypothetical protein
MADMTEIAALLTVVEKTHAQGAMFDNIKSAAMARLKQINDEHAPKAPVAPKEVAETAYSPKKGEK